MEAAGPNLFLAWRRAQTVGPKGSRIEAMPGRNKTARTAGIKA